MPPHLPARSVILSVVVVIANLLAFSSLGAANAESASADDTARFLAGMQPSAGSPLLPLTHDPVWQQHARRFGGIFENVESRQLAKIRAWSSAKITNPQPVLFYMFSGPDFLYANAFFPKQSTYVLAGLEPTGPVPDLTKLPRGSVGQALRNIEVSLQSILTNSFFMTNDMRDSLRDGPVKGTIPILYLFMARSGKTVRDVSLIKLDDQGIAQPDDGSGTASATADAAHGVKIVFSGEDGRIQTLYYFSTNIANDGFKASGFAKFCERLGTGDAFIKSASYLLHRSSFSDIRDFLLDHSDLVLEDDSGIPAGNFDGAWKLRPFGHYSGPISLFASRYQPKLKQLFQNGHTEALAFGIGYQSHAAGSNLVIAEKSDASKRDVQTSAVPHADVQAHAGIEPGSEPGKAAAGPDVKKRRFAVRARSRHKRHRTAPLYSAYPAPWVSSFSDRR
jgi:hypothetical protein